MISKRNLALLSGEELFTVANFFGVKVDNTKKYDILKVLKDNGITTERFINEFVEKQPGWTEDIVLDFPSNPPRNEQVVLEEVDADPTIFSNEEEDLETNLDLESFDVKTGEEDPGVTEEAAKEERYLIKMVRENNYFEFGKYTFTSKLPYQLMTKEDADNILRTETGFRQAFPSELEDIL